MRMILLGAPGAGKGTQGQRLAKVLDVPDISTGDLLRAAVEAGTPLGRAAKSVMDAGQLVSDDIVLGVIRERLAQPDVRDGFILDGFPRNVAQAEALDELLSQIGQPIELVLLINVDTDWLLQRLVGRRTCISCGAMYNIFSAPPKLDDRCDECGGRLRQRADDNEETIGNRLRIYETQTAPLIQRYRDSGRLRAVSGVGSVDDVFRAVMKVVEEERANRRAPDRADVIRSAIVRQQAVAKAEAPESPAATDDSTLPVEAAGAGETAATAPAAPAKKKPAASRAKKPAVSQADAAASEKKAAAKQTPAKPAATGTTAAKKAVKAPADAKQPTVKKAAAAKAAGKRVAGQKTAARKAPAKPAPAKKSAAKPAPVKKATAKKGVAKKAPAKKPVSKQSVASAARSAATKKAAGKKSATKNSATKKSATKKSVAKSATRQAVAKKAAASKSAATRKPAAKAVSGRAQKKSVAKKAPARPAARKRAAAGAKKRR